MVFFSKIVIYYIILYFSFKIIKEKILKKKNIKIEDFFCDKSIFKEEECEHNCNENKYQLIPYKHKKQSKITLQEVYDNFFKNKKTNIEDNIDLNILNVIKINKEVIKKDSIIFNEIQENLILEEPNNFLIYNFNSTKNNSYKIKCKLFINNCKNIKLVISDSKKRFIYDYNKENIINEKINEFGFILDNNFDIDENISIYFLFDKDEATKLVIESIFIEIIEKAFKKEDSLIIFDINNKYIPFYTDVENILDYIEYVDSNNVFFF